MVGLRCVRFLRASKRMEVGSDESIACRMESLRVMPPVPLTVRKAKEASVIQGVFVPKGTLLTIPVSIYLLIHSG